MQGTIGAVGRMQDVGRRVIRDYMPDQHREFYEMLPFVVLGSVGQDGTPFASVITGSPGFVTTPDARTVTLEHDLPIGNCVASGLSVGASVGILGIQLHTRRRNRVNGRVTSVSERTLTISVEHAFGNCPKYIQLKDTTSIPRQRDAGPVSYTYGTELSDDQRAVIRSADTMFVATYVDIVDEAGNRRRQVDVSHRGGKSGFVHVAVDDTLTIPDFVGNNFFNTLGNITVNPRAGLLFVNFDEGSTIQIEGSAEIITSGSEVESFRGAERIWKVRPRNIYQSIGRAIPLEFSAIREGLSAFLLETGAWADVEAQTKQAGPAWLSVRVDRVEDENAHTRSLAP